MFVLKIVNVDKGPPSSGIPVCCSPKSLHTAAPLGIASMNGRSRGGRGKTGWGMGDVEWGGGGGWGGEGKRCQGEEMGLGIVGSFRGHAFLFRSPRPHHTHREHAH